MDDQKEQKLFSEIIDPILRGVGLRRIGYEYSARSFGNVVATYESEQLRVVIVRDRGLWEARIGRPDTRDDLSLEMIFEYLGRPYSEDVARIPHYIVSNFATLCALFSSDNYETFKQAFEQFCIAEALKNFEPHARHFAEKKWPDDKARQDEHVRKVIGPLLEKSRSPIQVLSTFCEYRVYFVEGSLSALSEHPLDQLPKYFTCGFFLGNADWGSDDLRECVAHLMLAGGCYFVFHGRRSKDAEFIADSLRGAETDENVIMTISLGDDEDEIDFAFSVLMLGMLPTAPAYQVMWGGYLILATGSPEENTLARETFREARASVRRAIER